MAKKPIPIGIDDFSKIREKDYYYVDKSMFVADIVRDSAEVILLPRPRRFGKSLNMSMLRYFYDSSNPAYAQFFEGLEVSQHEDVMAELGRYPVFYLSFKDAKSRNFQNFLETVTLTIARTASLLFPKIPDQLSPFEARQLQALQLGEASEAQITQSLGTLSQLLHQTYGRKAVLLIDEYDIPIQAGYQHDYYDEVVNFMRNFLSIGFKGNAHLAKGVLTGVLRVAKESIFSGLNNLTVYSILNKPYSRHFGFSEDEVVRILADFELSDQADDVRRWYNGYSFGDSVLYNPWSILNYVKGHEDGFRPYWINSGSDELIRNMVLGGNLMGRNELAQLLDHESVSRELDETTNLRDLTPQSVWSLLTFSGYLKPKLSSDEARRQVYGLTIPNFEVWLFWHKVVRVWANNRLGESTWSLATDALLKEDVARFAEEVQTNVINVLSFHDTAQNQTEAFYHAFFLGLLSSLQQTYELKSNRESGLGRYDAALIPRDVQATGFLFEFKKRDGDADLDSAAMDALTQIRERDYAAELRERGVAKILAIGVALDGKRIAVTSAQL